jgi:hypothetical protein
MVNNELIIPFHTLQVPNARLGTEVPMASGTSMFGSTQLPGCQGDFCNFDVSVLENTDVSTVTTHIKAKIEDKVSEFRKKLKTPNSERKVDNDQLRDSMITDLMKAPPVKKMRPKALTAQQIDNAMLGYSSDEASLTSYDSSRQSMDGYRLMSNRIIIQSRQELPLVKLLLQRHKRGEKGDYISSENYNDIAASSKLPSHYYKDVACCSNCL